VGFQGRLGLLPHDAEVLSDTVAVSRSQGSLLFFNPGGPMLRAVPDDREQVRLAAVHLLDPEIGGGLKVGVLAGVLGVHRASLHRWRRTYEAESVAGLREERRGPKGPHKLRGAVLARAQRDLDQGCSQAEAARRAGVTEGAIRLALKQERLVRREAVGTATGAALNGPGERNERDHRTGGGVAVKRIEERTLARAGALVEAAPLFEPAGAVAKAGVLVALPAVVAQGLYEVAGQVYGMLRNGFYGLDAVLSTLVFMALLRIKSPEQLSSHAPGEFGQVLGLDRSPETKTVRRKLAELGARGQTLELQGALARRWAREQPKLLGFLYVDGHVRPYNGKKYTLPKTHVPRRRLCMPATTDYWVNDAFSDPLFYVTAPGNEGLLAVLEKAVLPEVRDLAGQRRVTLVMDRECWSPQRFEDWSQWGFDVMTYRKGSYEPWPEAEFTGHISRGGATREVTYHLAERPLVLANGFAVREVRCLTEDGHQTSIVTSRRDLSVLEVAVRMFSRWRQENFFRYMRHEFAIDHLCTYAVDPADPERTVPNPQRREKQKELASLRGELADLRQEYAERLENNPESQRRTVRGFKIANAELGRQIQALESRCQEIEEERRQLPQRVPVRNLVPEEKIVQLERERKTLTNVIKMAAYRAETALAELLRPFSSRHEDEARKLLKAAFQLPADLIADEARQLLEVRLHGMANARSTRALRALCEVMSAKEVRYPGTQLRMVFRAV